MITVRDKSQLGGREFKGLYLVLDHFWGGGVGVKNQYLWVFRKMIIFIMIMDILFFVGAGEVGVITKLDYN